VDLIILARRDEAREAGNKTINPGITNNERNSFQWKPICSFRDVMKTRAEKVVPTLSLRTIPGDSVIVFTEEDTIHEVWLKRREHVKAHQKITVV
jgi:hypothetical protein